MNLPCLLLCLAVVLAGCTNENTLPAYAYTCETAPPDSSLQHPRHETYQALLDAYHRRGMVGVTLLVRDQHGVWMGAAGTTNLETMEPVQPCHRFVIASISKVYTSAAIYRLVDKGLLTIDDPIRNFLSAEIVDEVENASTATVRQLLSHTSGIVDYYTLALELDRINTAHNQWSKERVLEYVYGKAADFAPGETYSYSNTNFLLLSLIAERVTGKPFAQVYQEEVFGPLGLASAYYDETTVVPPGTALGHVDFFGNDSYTPSPFLYVDELGIGGDGGVVSNVYDVERFFEQLLQPDYLSPASRANLLTWFDLPQDKIWDTYGQDQNGVGIERFNTPYGSAIGHSGGVDGFSSIALHFPDSGFSFVALHNLADDTDRIGPLSQEVLPVMFE